MSLVVRTGNSNCNCPYCAGHRVNHTNSLWATHPEIASLLKDSQIGHKIVAGSNRKEIFACDICGFEQKKIVVNITKNGFACSRCSDGISLAEKFMRNILEQIDTFFEMQKNFNWSNNKKYDFYIPLLNMIIETHGKQHYVDTGFSNLGGRNLDEEKENDQYKMRIAKENNIEKYIVLDCRETNLEYMKNSLINSELKEIYNLNNVNYLKAYEYACKTNLVKIACDLWNEGMENTSEIGKCLKISGKTVRDYLKKGVELGWCEYNPFEVSKKQAGKNGKKSAKSVVQLNKDGTYIKTWNSIVDVENELGINSSNISGVCKGHRKSTFGFKWMYKKDYENFLLCNNN